MAQGIAKVIGARCGSRWLQREVRGVSKGTKFCDFTLIQLPVVIAIIAILAEQKLQRAVHAPSLFSAAVAYRLLSTA